MRKKNRKLRRLRELYPDIRIKLFYARDFRMLMLKFGRLALLDELSGATGQSTPPRSARSATPDRPRTRRSPRPGGARRPAEVDAVAVEDVAGRVDRPPPSPGSPSPPAGGR